MKGLTTTGFLPCKLPEIISEIAIFLRERFGSVQTDDASVIGQLIGVFGKPAADLWEQAQNIYLGLNPETATGISLDYCVAFNGLIRLEQLPSEVVVGLCGTVNSTIPEGTIFKSSTSESFFTMLNDVQIKLTEHKKLFLLMSTISANTVYSVSVTNGSTTRVYSGNSGPSPTINSMCQYLVDNMNADGLGFVTATYTGSGGIVMDVKPAYSTFSVLLSNGIDYYVPANCVCTVAGNIPVSAKIISVIQTPRSGLSAVLNFEDGTRGREEESDAELRLRRKASLKVQGNANLEAMVAKMIRDVPGVIACKGFENVTDSTVAGRPPHSIEIVVAGGLPADIIKQIWITKGGGIQTYGNTSGTVIDSNGDIQSLNFTRPVSVYITVRADIQLYNEEIFPPDGLAQVQAKIFAYGITFTIGLDVLPQRFLSPLYSIPGIEKVTMLVGWSLDPNVVPMLSENIIRIGQTQIASFSELRISATLPS